MRMAAMKEAASSCFKDKWMDDSMPNPHQVNMCIERVKNKHMGVFYQNLVNLRDSNRFRYQDCIVAAGNDIQASVFCVRDYLTGIDADNAKLKAIVEEKCSKYL